MKKIIVLLVLVLILALALPAFAAGDNNEITDLQNQIRELQQKLYQEYAEQGGQNPEGGFYGAGGYGCPMGAGGFGGGMMGGYGTMNGYGMGI